MCFSIFCFFNLQKTEKHNTEKQFKNRENTSKPERTPLNRENTSKKRENTANKDRSQIEHLL